MNTDKINMSKEMVKNDQKQIEYEHRDSKIWTETS